MRRGLTVRGPATPDQAWERYAVPARWPSWAPQIRRVEYEPARIEAGASGTVVGLGGVRAAFTVLEVDETGRMWAWRVRVGPARLRLHHGIEAAGAGCRATLVIQGPAPVVLAYAPVARLALRGLVA